MTTSLTCLAHSMLNGTEWKIQELRILSQTLKFVTSVTILRSTEYCISAEYLRTEPVLDVLAHREVPMEQRFHTSRSHYSVQRTEYSVQYSSYSYHMLAL